MELQVFGKNMEVSQQIQDYVQKNHYFPKTLRFLRGILSKLDKILELYNIELKYPHNRIERLSYQTRMVFD